MPITQAQLEELKAHIDEPTAHRELECQPFLIHAAGYLLPGSPTEIIGLTEERSYFGRADFIVGATINDDLNRQTRHAYIWELKAPQCYLFERDTNNRCRPTMDFFQAENQLLHYYYQAASDELFRERMQILDHTNIHLGGIVIGTRERMLRGSMEFLAVQKADVALKVRENYFYGRRGVRILTWDRILDYLRPISQR